MRQATTAEVRLDAVGVARFSGAVWSIGGFERLLRATSAVAHCSSRSKGRSWLEPAGNLVNVGQHDGKLVGASGGHVASNEQGQPLDPCCRHCLPNILLPLSDADGG